MKLKTVAIGLCVSVASIMLLFATLEVGIRGYEALEAAFPTPPLHITTDLPTLYGLNPEHPDINSQGLRDELVSIPKPEGTLRILVLGDSIAYGKDVSSDKTFPNQLEKMIRRTFGSAEVINAGVAGYTAYNELQYYLTQGREFEPDIVIVAFCMNDVANPRLHWGYTEERVARIPYQAIPNHDYDSAHAMPIHNRQLRREKRIAKRASQPNKSRKSLGEYSKLYQAVEERLARVVRGSRKDTESTDPNAAEKIPTFITGEDSLSIEVLMDAASPERRWLASIYDELHDAVRADQSTLIIAFFPLAYQMREDYPYIPQDDLMEYCEERSIPCLDLQAQFKQYEAEQVFRLTKSGYFDIWHLTEYGHQVSAKAILRFLHQAKLVEAGNEERSPNSGG